jgi:hypothetical protein
MSEPKQVSGNELQEEASQNIDHIFSWKDSLLSCSPVKLPVMLHAAHHIGKKGY